MKTGQIIIRKVRANDDPHLGHIIQEVFDEHEAPQEGTVYSDPTTFRLFELFSIPRSVLWVAEQEGNIVGCCGVYPTNGLSPDTAELVKFYLLHFMRGQGIGKELLNKSVASAIEFGYKKLYLESLPHFSNAVGMYVRLGFRPIDQPIGNSGHNACTIWMLKEL